MYDIFMKICHLRCRQALECRKKAQNNSLMGILRFWEENLDGQKQGQVRLIFRRFLKCLQYDKNFGLVRFGKLIHLKIRPEIIEFLE